jgi:hypothetical protein
MGKRAPADCPKVNKNNMLGKPLPELRNRAEMVGSVGRFLPGRQIDLSYLIFANATASEI